MNGATQTFGKIAVTTRYSEYNDVSFVVVKAGIVTMQGSAEGRAFPDLWRVRVGSRDFGRRGTGEIRGLTVRGRMIAKVLRAMEAGRI